VAAADVVGAGTAAAAAVETGAMKVTEYAKWNMKVCVQVAGVVGKASGDQLPPCSLHGGHLQTLCMLEAFPHQARMNLLGVSCGVVQTHAALCLSKGLSVSRIRRR
jgi:hypothetical protein